jgi:hypothetical protein
VALVVLALGLLVGCTLIFPRYLAASDMDHAKVTPTELAKARNDVRTTLLQGFGGMVLLLGAYLTWRQTQIRRAASHDELELSREGQLTDRFTRAVEQLGSRRRPRGSPPPGARGSPELQLEQLSEGFDWRQAGAVMDDEPG